MKLGKSELYSSLKVYATILVVVAHVTRMYTGIGVVTPIMESSLLSYLTKFIYSFHMPLFICISGMVYGYCISNGKYNDIKKFIINKGERLLIPYLIIGCIYVAPVMVLYRFTELGFVRYIVEGILLGKNSRHLWYLLVLFEIFVCCAIARKINLKINRFIVLLILLAIAFIPSIIPITTLFALDSLPYYAVFFFMGILIDKKLSNISEISINKSWILILMIVIMISLFKFNNLVTKIPIATLGIIISIWIIGLFGNIMRKSKIYEYINRDGFGIYLFHPMIIYIAFYYLGNLKISPIILSIFVTLLAFLLSIILTFIIRKLNLQVIIGENNTPLRKKVSKKKFEPKNI